MTHASDAMWSRGAVAHTVINPPQAPVYQYPPDNNAPGTGGPRGRIPRFLLLLIAGIAILGLGIGGGWALRGATTPGAIAPSPTEAAPSTAAAGGLSPTQAKQQACDGYSTLGAQWSSGYHDWYASVSSVGQGWTWANPTVKAATDKFFPLQSQIANSLRALVTPATPAPVGKAINDYASAILSYAATQNTDTPSSEMDARMDRINAAADVVIRECGI
ncbi:hypothetical protein [Mycobacteroides abscessus]|uniref:hypothetical protein n=1 Tax=Mycobacteroides abscessus TaxID=36809 RepID=UPI00092C321A|nr:hypothetical protein [Mycobacteroides abscessus]SIA23367.1 Uncharacterised protein [Mycobacteroides abscessus subsp. abscessus]SKT81380.1 Uncharacterised protein [Mycobacteroides abscessus subsp. massiliense]SKT98784.1 Uncharacterised protein [Mycobacteroides abscessus subsp. massiliense]